MAYEQVISFDNLYKGLKESCRNIRWKDSTVGYEGNALKNTYRLRQTLLNCTYKIDRYQHFTIYEPKRRDIGINLNILECKEINKKINCIWSLRY